MDEYRYKRYLEKAVRYLAEERYHKALKYMNKVVDILGNDLDRLNAKFWSDKEFFHIEIEDYEGALKCIPYGIAADPKLYIEKAGYFFDKESYGLALIYYDELVEVFPNNEHLWWYKGICNQEIGDLNWLWIVLIGVFILIPLIPHIGYIKGIFY